MTSIPNLSTVLKAVIKVLAAASVSAGVDDAGGEERAEEMMETMESRSAGVSDVPKRDFTDEGGMDLRRCHFPSSPEEAFHSRWNSNMFFGDSFLVACVGVEG